MKEASTGPVSGLRPSARADTTSAGRTLGNIFNKNLRLSLNQSFQYKNVGDPVKLKADQKDEAEKRSQPRE